MRVLDAIQSVYTGENRPRKQRAGSLELNLEHHYNPCDIKQDYLEKHRYTLLFEVQYNLSGNASEEERSVAKDNVTRLFRRNIYGELCGDISEVMYHLFEASSYDPDVKKAEQLLNEILEKLR